MPASERKPPRFITGKVSHFPAAPLPVIVSTMPRQKDIDLADMTAEQELRSLLQWAEQMQLANVAAALRRILTQIASGRIERPRHVSQGVHCAAFRLFVLAAFA